MATKEAPKKDDVEEVVAPPKKSRKLLIIIVSAVVVTLSLGAALGYVLGHKKSSAGDASPQAAAADEKQQDDKKKDEAKKPPVFIALDPFTVNLQPDNTTGEQFLQVVVSLRVGDEKKGEDLKAFMPQIRHEILSLAGSRKASEITSPDGRELLADDIKDVVNDVLGYEPPKRARRKRKDDLDDDAPVMSVFFTQFIVQ
ncbi:MAG: flagellar basal body-associated protein FliL [Rhodocyclales bacterium]|nr:flagellar basal body-associated protein FliL [Rhodocyclales bacterium]MDB5889167.1 flagellar basal body-associated protein FliL [Rhodocyclales bacterium]